LEASSQTVHRFPPIGQVVCVGSHAKARSFGAHGADRFVKTRDFGKVREAVAYLKDKGVAICGVEITPAAVPIETHPFTGPTAFLMGAEGDGMPSTHKALCDHFVYIRHHGTGTASLNVVVAASIVLHHYGVWAGYGETARETGRDKFVVPPAPPAGGGADSEQAAQRRVAKAAERAELDAAEAGALAVRWDDDDDEGGDVEEDGDED